MPQPDLLTLDTTVIGALDLDQYFGVWAIEETRFLAAFEMVAGMDLAAHIQAAAKKEKAPETKARSQGGIALIDLMGSMTKRGSSLSSAGSTIELRRQVRQAAADPNIDAILIRIDSPGGTVAGTADLGADVAAAAATKPVWAFVEDLGASAAYWIASQCSKIVANDRTALIGSIGTFMGLYDMSGNAAQKGIKPVVIKSGAHKGAGFPGSEITDAQKAIWQTIIDQTQAEFTAAVSRGRQMPAARVAALADGRVHTADVARELGLIDGIQTFDQTLAALAADASKRSKRMSESTAPQAASYEEIKSACKGADAAFICAQLERKATVDQAREAWMTAQEERVAKAQKDAADARKEADEAKAAAKRPGVQALETKPGKRTAGDDADVDAASAESFEAAVNAKVRGGMERRKAVVAVCKARPDLHRAYLEATNPKAKAAIAGRFEG